MGVKRDVGGACEQEGCQTTHNEGTGGAEGKGPTGVEVSGVVRDQDTNEVETLCLGRSGEMRLSGQLPTSWGLRGCSPTPPPDSQQRGGLRSRNLTEQCDPLDDHRNGSSCAHP